jgi:hypothetical protein
MERYRLESCFLLFFFLLLSCAKKTVDVDLREVELSEVLEEVRQNRENIRSVKGLASVRITAPENAVSFRQVTIAERPNLFYLEALDPLGRTAGIVTSDREKIYLIFGKERQVFDSREFSLSSIYPQFPAKVSPDNLVNFLLGCPPKEINYDDSLVYLSDTPDHLLLTFFNENAEKEAVLWVNPSDHRIEKAQVNLDGQLVTSEFRDFIKTDAGFLFPKSLELRFGNSLISVEYDDEVEINSDIDESLFQPWEPVAGLIEPR